MIAPRSKEPRTVRIVKAKSHRGISADELLPIEEFQRRLAISRKGLKVLRQKGLKLIAVGVRKYVLGEDVLELFRQLRDGGPA